MVANQTAARGCQNRLWQGYEKNLHASILLRPEFDQDKDHEMLYVGATSLGNAIAAHVSPMTALSYSWPNDISIAGNKVASLWLDQGQSASGRWLAVTCSVNVRQSPDDFSLPALSILEAEGSSDLTASVLLESWTRQFVRLINLWSDQGFEKIFRLWQVRSESIGKTISLKNKESMEQGEIIGITEKGDMIATLASGSEIEISTQAYMNSNI